MAVEVIHVSGDLDLASVDALVARITVSTAPVVELDTAAVAFADSTGLRGLLQAREQLETEGRRLRVGSRSAAITRLFEVAGVQDLFD